MLSVRCVPHLSNLVTVSSGNIQDNCGVLSAVIATVPQFMSAYIADILVAVSAVSQSKLLLILNSISSKTAYPS